MHFIFPDCSVASYAHIEDKWLHYNDMLLLPVGLAYHINLLQYYIVA